MNWDFEEEILLIDLYFYIKSHNSEYEQKAIEILSDCLSRRAVLQGYSIDSTFRNINGIKMKIQNIEYIATKGKKGLSSHSRLDQRVYYFSVNKPIKYKYMLNMIKKKYDLYYDNFSSTEHLDKKNIELIDQTRNEAINKTYINIEVLDSEEIIINKYKINPKLLNNELIENTKFSERIKNILARNNIFEVIDLLYMKYDDLLSLSGIGETSANELKSYFIKLKKNEINYKREKAAYYNNLFLLHSEEVKSNDFSFINKKLLPKSEKEIVEGIIEAYTIIDYDLIEDCVKDDKKATPIINMLRSYYSRHNIIENRKKEISEIISYIPKARIKKKALWYIKAYTEDNDKQNMLKLFYQDANTSLGVVKNDLEILDYDKYRELYKFLNWCTYNTKKEVKDYFNKFDKQDRVLSILRKRQDKITLEEISIEYNITRERVRQIELKAKNIFQAWEGKNKILLKISADEKDSIFLTNEDILKHVGDNALLLIYLLKSIVNPKSYCYDSDLNIFFVRDKKIIKRIKEYVNTIPDLLNRDKLKYYLDKGTRDYNIPKKVLEKAIYHNFNQTHNIFHRGSLTYSTIYSFILSKYFNHGLRIYNMKDIQKFREAVKSEFGEIKLPNNNRAISARLIDIGILCGKGMYKPKKDKYIPKYLSDKILRYIDKSKNVVIMDNALYNIFEYDLAKYDIDNKYYMHAILKQLFNDKFTFRKDYICKDESITSISHDLVSYISNSKCPVTKKEIYKAFPGISDIMIYFATSDTNILNYFGAYIDSKKLNTTKKDNEYFKVTIDRLLLTSEIIHCKEIFQYIERDNPYILNRLYINSAFSLYSLLESQLDDEYQFLRPFISQQDTVIEKPLERLREFVYSFDKIAISDILDFARENHYQINSILGLLNSFNDKYIMCDQENLVSIEFIELKQTVVDKMEEIIVENISKAIPIRELTCIYKFPRISIPWSEWLIYSILNKWSNRINVSVTSNQLKNSVPYVYLKEHLYKEDVLSITEKYTKKNKFNTNIIYDDLDNIDDLIIEYVEEEL